MDEAQRAQGFHQMQFARVELVKILVAGEHVGELAHHGGAIAREQHPQVLHRGSHARVVEVDEMRPVRFGALGPQHVAGMAVAVQPQGAYLARALVTAAYALQRLLHHAGPGGREIARDEIVREQIVARFLAKARDVESRPRAKRR